MNQFQHSDDIIYGEGLEPVGYHEGAFLQPAGIGALRSGDHGLEAVPLENPYQTQLPQLLFGKEEKEAYPTNTNLPERDVVLLSNSNPRQRSTSRWWWIAAVLTGMIIAGIIVGIVEGLRHRRSQGARTDTPVAAAASNNTSNHTTSTSNLATSTSSLSTSDLSVTGAFNGTGLDLVSATNIYDDLFMYFQHFSGEIRYSALRDSSGWSGGESAQTVISSNVKNRTQLTGATIKADNLWTAYLFYIDEAGIVQDVFQNNNSNGNGKYSAGEFGSLNIQFADGPNAALEVCQDELWYGSNVGNSPGIRLYIGQQDGLVHEYMLDLDSNKWSTGYIFPNSNANAGAACWPGGYSGISYLYLQNAQKELQMWWIDSNTNAINSTTHPLGVWIPGPIAAGLDIRPDSSIAMSYFVYFQDSKSRILGIFPNATAETSTWGGAPFQVGIGTAIPGTRITCQCFYPSTTSPSGIYVFFQTNASNVVENVRPQYGGAWSLDFVPVG